MKEKRNSIMSIPERIYLSPPHMSGKELEFIKKAFESNYIAPLGPMVDELEKSVCEYTGYPYAVALSSGTAALHLALLSIGIKPNDEVWASSLTFIGSVSPIMFCGAIPSFVDSSFNDWNIDVDLLEESLKKAKKNNILPKALIVTDLYGQACDYDRLIEVTNAFSITLISDAAESLGSSYKKSKCSTDIAAFSFNGNKIITSSGGGMLVSKDESLIKYARYLSQQARDETPYYQHSVIGYNYRMSNISAAIGLAQLDVLDKRVQKKKEIFEYYKENLANIEEINFMPVSKFGNPNYWLTVITIDPESGLSPEALRVKLEEYNIESRPLWKPMHKQPVFSHNTMYGGEVSEKLFETGLCLPSGTALSRVQQDKVIEIIVKCLR